MEEKTIKVSKNNWKKLYSKKIKEDAATIDEIITELLKKDE